MHTPSLSVVIPVRDGGEPFRKVLASIGASEFRDFELIVVDDGSRDDSASLALSSGARLFATARASSGPAAARNRGAEEAAGRVLCFIDADCEVHPATLGRIASAFEDDAALSALFGSYDDEPAAPNFVAQYKNLLHHHTHQNGRGEASTFWAGCGAVRRDFFLKVGGFDPARYPRPSIEDIELGYRMRDAGGTIRLDPSITVKHHKAWSLRSLLASDVFDRALPWSRLMLGRKHLTNDLNVDARGRLSAIAALILVLAVCATPLLHVAAFGAIAAAALLIVLNRSLYGFLLRSRGAWFLVRALPLHWLYFLYSSAAFGIASVQTAAAAVWSSELPENGGPSRP